MKTLYFFIGTEAELMKMYCVVQEARKRGYECKIISNGQNNIKGTYFLDILGGTIDIDLTCYAAKEKNMLEYLKWFIKTERLGVKKLKDEIKNADSKDVLMIVHGDTMSTLMGARIAQKCKMDYVHVESGPRSFNWLSPFPEEIDRYFSSKKSKINFCSRQEFTDMAAKYFKGKAVNTEYNTGIETLYLALEHNEVSKPQRIIEEKYFLVAIHRQENLMSETFMTKAFEEIIDLSNDMKCLFIYHEQTRNALEKVGMWEKVKACENIVIVPRQGYFDFINSVENSEFVVADGCGNQQEFYYLGKPYLIMRTEVEQNSDGLQWNAIYFENDYSNIRKFYENYNIYKKERVIPKILPSQIIMNTLDEYFME